MVSNVSGIRLKRLLMRVSLPIFLVCPSSPNGNIVFYQVELFAENNLDLPALNPVNVSSTSYNFTGLAPFTGYSVQVCAYTSTCGDIATLNVTTLGGVKGHAQLKLKHEARVLFHVCTRCKDITYTDYFNQYCKTFFLLLQYLQNTNELHTCTCITYVHIHIAVL